MDKRVIFAVAGSGKTTHIIDNLNLENKFLLITYTINNVHNLRTGILKKIRILSREYQALFILLILIRVLL